MTDVHVRVSVPATEPLDPLHFWTEARDGRLYLELHAPVDQDPTLILITDDSRYRVLEYRQRRLSWRVPMVLAGEPVWEAMMTLRPLAARIAAGMAPPDEYRHTSAPELDADATEAAAELAERLAEVLEPLPRVEEVPVSAISPDLVRDAVGADLTDEGLADVVAQLTATVPPSRPGDVVIVAGLEQWVEDARVAARDQVRSRLAIVATLADGGRAERDELIRRISGWHDAADTQRSLGAAAGLTHGAVQKILAKVADRDDALARLAPAVDTLVRAWAPEPLPQLDDRRTDRDDGWEDEEDDGYYGSEQHASEEFWARRRLDDLRARKTCGVDGCGKAARRIVKRWQVDDTIHMSADRDDPARDAQGYVTLSVAPRFNGQPTWTVCGSAHARIIIDADRAKPVINGSVPGGQPYHYEIDSYRHQPPEEDLPEPVLKTKRSLELLGHSLGEFTRAIGAGDMSGAALYLRSLQRDVARGALNLAALQTRTTPATPYRHGDPEPEPDVLLVRDGDTIYVREPRFMSDDDADAVWTEQARRGAVQLTWEELTASVAGRTLHAIPHAEFVLPSNRPYDDEDGVDGYDDDWSEPDPPEDY